MVVAKFLFLMKNYIFIFFFSLSCFSWGQKNIHALWTHQLQTYVDDEGNVNYAQWKNDSSGLEDYIQNLESNPPQKYWTKGDSLAYFINAYNAVTVKLILDNYPLKSIRKLITPWRFKRFRLGDKKVSLGHIEHQILRKMNEPRIHFAINCASASCPRLQKQAFVSHRLDKQLEEVTRTFINDTTKNQISAEALKLSKIFFWFGSDFGNREDRRAFIQKYTSVALLPKAKIGFLPYDWSLNE